MKFSRYIGLQNVSCEFSLHSFVLDCIKQSYHAGSFLLASYHCLMTFILKQPSLLFSKIRQPPTFPQGRPCSILGRIRLNLRVRDGYGCFPYPHRHRKVRYLRVTRVSAQTIRKAVTNLFVIRLLIGCISDIVATEQALLAMLHLHRKLLDN